MKIKRKIMATFSPEEREIINKIMYMFANYDDEDWELLKQCFYDELCVDIDDLFEDLERIRDYMVEHS